MDDRSERKIIDFLACNPSLDGDDNLQWIIRREYWSNCHGGHTDALDACIQIISKAGIAGPVYKGLDDPKRPRSSR